MNGVAGRLDGQVAVVTGGGAGIGRAIALAFARAGARVVIADLHGGHAEGVAGEITGAGGAALACQTDVRSPEDVARLCAQTVETFGRVDILVNNAGVVHVTPLLEIPLELWRRVFAVNVEGPLLTTQRMAQFMRPQEPHPASGCRGKIINVSSAAAEVGRPLHAAYGASKAALNHLSKSSALVLAPWAIATTVLYPGNVMEGMWQRLQYEVAAAEGRTVAEVVRERDFQSAEEVAALALGIAAVPGMSMNARLVWHDGHDTPL